MKVFLSPKVVLTDRDCAQVDLDFVFIAAALFPSDNVHQQPVQTQNAH